MASVNKVLILGNLGQNPETKTFPNGGKVCTLSVATTDRWRDKQSGETREKTEWHRVVIYNENLADLAAKYLVKGSKVYLEGALQTRKWEKDGQDHYATEIVLQAFNAQLVLLDPPPADSRDDNSRRDEQRNDDRNYQRRDASRRDDDRRDDRRDDSRGASRPSAKPSFDAGRMDDDIPF